MPLKGGNMANDCIQLLIMKEYQNLKMAEASNWDGVAYIGKRKHISYLAKIEQLQNPGVYFLLGNNNTTGEKTLYIGETENITNRLQTHSCDKKKEWFEDFIIFTSKKGDLNKAHVKYIEAVFIELAKENLTTINLDNSVTSHSKKDGKLQAFDLAKAEGFQEKMIFILNNLGLIDFVKTNKEKQEIKQKNIFYLPLTQNRIDKSGNIVTAKMVITENGYMVLKGSYVESEERAPSFKKHIYYKIRKKLENDNLFVKSDIEGLWITKEDIPFNSCSAAAATIKNRATNGRTEWKLSDGTTLNDYENNCNL